MAELTQVEVFLCLARELHFGRTAEVLHISQSKVSKTIAVLEREIGGALFERTSRKVRLTPLGAHLLERVEPAYRDLVDAVSQTRKSAQQVRDTLRIGFVSTTGGTTLTRLVSAFQNLYPETRIDLIELSYSEMYRALRKNEVDILLAWKTPELDSDFTQGPTLDSQTRVAAIAANHPLAKNTDISVLDINNWVQAGESVPQSIAHLFLPLTTEDGSVIPRDDFKFRSVAEMATLIAQCRLSHATINSFAEMMNRDDIVYVPIRDLPPIQLSLIWCSSHEDATIRAAVTAAEKLAGEMLA